MSSIHSLGKLKGVVQHYSWGGFNYLPQLLGKENASGEPWAEYWLGAHPNHPALLQNGSEQPLSTLLSDNASSLLGDAVAGKFASLPYLLKVLDVRQMLSIQVHPSKQSAGIGYDDEDSRGIPLKAPHRNYKDRNHKPELMVALGDFWLLHGFKPAAEVENVLEATPELRHLVPLFRSGSYKGLYEKLMAMEQAEVNAILDPLVKRVVPLYESDRLPKSSEDFWAARAALSFCKDNNYDRGIFSIYIFNLLNLKEGEGVFQPEGMPHAYLEGQNVEVMANSDNVLRAGLTDKHVDVPELMKHVVFAPKYPNVLKPAGGSHTVYASPAEEFELHRYKPRRAEPLEIEATTGEIFLVIAGSITATVDGQSVEAGTGEAVFAGAGGNVRIMGEDGTDLFRVTVPA